MATLSIDPVTRIEGHLKAEIVIENNIVTDAHVGGGMYRGFESILRGRDPRDAPQITERICGLCPVSHAMASSMALERAAKLTIPSGARLMRNLMHGANFLQSHILHFYHLAGLDFFQGPDSPPFIPRYPHPDQRLSPAQNAVSLDEYLEALNVRRICHEMTALFGGRMPHVQAVLAGGTTAKPTAAQIAEYTTRAEQVAAFVENKYLPLAYSMAAAYPDLCDMAPGYRSALSMGVFPLDDAGMEYVFKPGVYYEGKDYPFEAKEVFESVRYSWFTPASSGRLAEQNDTVVDRNKPDAYSFVKAPRYAGHAMEVGPHARMWINNTPISPTGRAFMKEHFKKEVVHFRDFGENFVFSIMGRNLARAEESWIVTYAIKKWLSELSPDMETLVPFVTPENAEGFAVTEAPRGSLLHYINIRDGKIDNYQLVPATLWNCSPRDDDGQPGPVEKALIGLPIPNEDSPINALRTIRAFDP